MEAGDLENISIYPLEKESTQNGIYHINYKWNMTTFWVE